MIHRYNISDKTDKTDKKFYTLLFLSEVTIVEYCINIYICFNHLFCVGKEICSKGGEV